MDYSISTDYFTLQAIDESRLLRLAANKDVSRTTIPAKGPRSAVWAQLICDDDYQKLDTSESESDYCLNCRKKCPRQIKEATAWVSNNKNKVRAIWNRMVMSLLMRFTDGDTICKPRLRRVS